jgi:hypothetical protein
MRHIIFTMQFKGAATPGAEPGVMKVTTTATSCAVRTVVGADGVNGAFEPAEGGLAYFESEVRTAAAEGFDENGAITFGDGDHTLRFSTVGQGYLARNAETNTMAGAVAWRVTGGEGQFDGATGLITSNFLVSEKGEVTDYQFGVIFVK